MPGGCGGIRRRPGRCWKCPSTGAGRSLLPGLGNFPAWLSHRLCRRGGGDAGRRLGLRARGWEPRVGAAGTEGHGMGGRKKPARPGEGQTDVQADGRGRVGICRQPHASAFVTGFAEPCEKRSDRNIKAFHWRLRRRCLARAPPSHARHPPATHPPALFFSLGGGGTGDFGCQRCFAARCRQPARPARARRPSARATERGAGRVRGAPRQTPPVPGYPLQTAPRRGLRPGGFNEENTPEGSGGRAAAAASRD